MASDQDNDTNVPKSLPDTDLRCSHGELCALWAAVLASVCICMWGGSVSNKARQAQASMALNRGEFPVFFFLQSLCMQMWNCMCGQGYSAVSSKHSDQIILVSLHRIRLWLLTDL